MGPRLAALVRLRRDLLRQGRVVDAQPRLRPWLRRRGRREDPGRHQHRDLDRRPVDDRAPRGRQVADRARREGLRHGPLRLAGLRRGRGGADGAGDVPPRAPADRVDPARLPGRAAADARRRPPRAVPAGPARHLPGALPALRRGLRGQRPGVVPRAAGPRHGRRARPRRLGAGPRAALASLAAHRRRRVGPGARHEVDRRLPPGRLRDPGLALERRCAPLGRGTPGAAALGRRRRAARVRAPGRGRRGRLRRDLGRVAGQRRGLRGVALLDAVHALRGRGALRRRRDRQRGGGDGVVADRVRARRQRPGRDRAVVALALVLPPGRLHLPRPLPELLDAHLRLRPARLAAAQPAGGHLRRHRHRARYGRLHRARGQRLPAPGAADRHPGDLVGRPARPARRGRAVGGPAGLARPAGGGRGAGDLAAVAAVRRPPDLLLLRRRDAAVPGAGRRAVPGPAHRTAGWEQPQAYRRRGRGRVVPGPGRAQRGVVLAAVDRPAAHPRGVAGPDVVRPLDLSPPPGRPVSRPVSRRARSRPRPRAGRCWRRTARRGR
ncbi:hypothetical protein NOCARDAX2BIS_640002 [Nocardioides sp. AX2bis]|nr:hypothetical protein NOCARDAX2BIS_640002 [Nocardioides sp. AX2bis]